MKTHSMIVLMLLLSPVVAAQPASSLYPKYDLQVALDPSADHLEGQGTIWIPPSPDVRPTIGFALSKSMRDFTVTVLEPPELAGVPAIEAGQAVGDPDLWFMRATAPFPSGVPVRVRVSW